MITIAEEFAKLSIAQPTHYRNLTVFPLLRADTAAAPGYLLADEAIAQGLARVTEFNGGRVSELRFENNAPMHVLIIDGEELVGAKQNRTVNLTILIPAKSSTVIPVSCVEAGRWHAESSEFCSIQDVLFPAARAARTDQVSESMRQGGTRRSDQARLWNDIATKAARMDAASPTQDMSAIFARHMASVEDYSRAFTWCDGQAGAVFAISGQPLGLDVFDHTQTMRRMFAKLIRSYALDALEHGHYFLPAPAETATALLEDVRKAVTHVAPAIGLGKDVRLSGPTVSGAALWADERHIHVCAFRKSGSGSPGEGLISRLVRATRRRAGMA